MSTESNDNGYRLAHTMIRVLDLEKSIHFYCDILGMQVLRRTDYPGGSYTKDRKSVVQGKSVDLGGRRIIKKKNRTRTYPSHTTYDTI